MTRSVTHILLILLVLTCPVQCVVAGDTCCASTPVASSDSTTDSLTDAAQTCPSSRSCCHDSASDMDVRKGTGDQPAHTPHSDDDCQCDCLCKGAISSSVRIADDFEAAPLNSIATRRADGTVLSCRVDAPPTDPPNPISGREIRTLRMSFQV